jgi:hypothetical protein
VYFSVLGTVTPTSTKSYRLSLPRQRGREAREKLKQSRDLARK